jgi:hypothetical protein
LVGNRQVRNWTAARWYPFGGGSQVKKITVINRLENEDGNFIELTHNNAEEGRVFRVEIKNQSAHWSEWFTSMSSDLNERLARETYEELKEQIQRKVMA